MSSAHTPGPWAAKRRDSGWDIVGPDGGGYGKELCVVVSRGSEVQAANARLIAAAPDMLAALEQALYYVENHPRANQADPVQDAVIASYIETISAAIAKARGES